MRVLKFGGTSLADAERFLNVSEIVVNTHRKSQVALVLSAPARVTKRLEQYEDRNYKPHQRLSKFRNFQH